MRSSLLIIFFAVFFISADAQHHHYIYIQSEPQQPFYIKLNNTPLSSNTSGFLIIPKLTDTLYNIIAGFPQNAFPEYRFVIREIRQDKGFTLKNFNEKGWGLIDNQTQEIQMGERVAAEKQEAEYIPPARTNDAFTVVLAAVINDPALPGTELVSNTSSATAIVMAPAEKRNSPKAESIPPKVEPEVKNNSAAGESANAGSTKKNRESADVKTKLPVDTASAKLAENTDDKIAKANPKPATAKRSIKKISEKPGKEGLGLVYADINENGRSDTIQILIPNEKITVAKTQPKRIAENVQDSPVSKRTVTPVAEIPKDTQTVAKEFQLSDSSANAGLNKKDTTLMNSRGGMRADCKKMATDKDVQAIRRRIIAIRETDDMVSSALRDFKSKCFSTDQIRSVSIVFISDEGKYKLMDAAYPFVYDPMNFKTLESLLNDDYYVNRFRSLLK